MATTSYPSAVWDGSGVKTTDGGAPTAAEWDQLVAEIQEMQTRSVAPAPTAGTGVTIAAGSPKLRTEVISLASLVVNTTDASTAGAHGSHKLLDFPEGNILILGAVTDLTIVAGAGGLTDTSAVVAALGSVTTQTDNETLTTTESDIVPSTAATLSSGTGTFKGKSTAPVTLDGTSTAADCFLNFATVDAGSSADDTLTVTGTVTISWMNLGDVA